MSVVRSDITTYLETENNEVVALYNKRFPLANMPDRKAWDGENLDYLLATRPGGGFGIVGTDNALNGQGTGKRNAKYTIGISKNFGTIQMDLVTMRMQAAGAMRKLGTYVADCEVDYYQHNEILMCGAGDGLLGTHATGISTGVTLTGVKGPYGTTHIQRHHLWKGQRIQVGNDGNKENKIVSNIAYVSGTDSYTVTITVALTNNQTNVNLYIFGTSTTGSVVRPGILALCDNDNTLGASGGTQIDRSTSANSDFRAFVSDKDEVLSVAFADDPVAVIQAAGDNARVWGGIEDEDELVHFYHPRVLSYVTRKLKDKVTFTGKTVFGWPVLENIIPRHNFMMDLFTWPFGYGCGTQKGNFDRPVIMDPKWLVGTEGEMLRKAGYIESEGVFGSLDYLAFRNPAAAYQLYGLTGSDYEQKAY